MHRTTAYFVQLDGLVRLFSLVFCARVMLLASSLTLRELYSCLSRECAVRLDRSNSQAPREVL